MQGVSETLAGRIAILDLLGLSQSEIEKKPFSTKPYVPLRKYDHFEELSINEVYYRVWRGSYPELYKNKELEWDRFYSSYIQTYIERDIRNLAQVADEKKFFVFLSVLAARIGQLINYDDISKDVGISVKKIKEWVSLLETSGIIYLLQPYYSNLTNRMIKTPKLYFLDTGLAAYLTRWDTFQVLEKGAMSGAFFENYVISEIVKSYWHNGKEIGNLFFYRDRDGKEIDLLIDKNGKLYPIEIKKKSNPTIQDIKHFSVLNKFKKPIDCGSVICLCDDWIPLTEKVNAVNVGII